MNNLTIGRRLALAFGAICLLIVILVGVALWGLASLGEARAKAADAKAVALQSTRLDQLSSEVAGLQLVYVLRAQAGTPGATDDAQGARKDFLAAVAEMTKKQQALQAFSLPPEQAALLNAEIQKENALVASSQNIINLLRQNTAASRAAVVQAATQSENADNVTSSAQIDQLNSQLQSEITALDAAYETTKTQTTWIIVVTGAIALVLALVLGFFISRSITRPLRRTVDLLNGVAGGDLTNRLETHSRDEVGQMGVALNEALDRMTETIGGIDRGATTLSAASEELSSVSRQMSSASEETASQAASVSAAAEQVSHNVQAVAVASEQLGASEDEISRNTTEAAQVAATAVTAAESANATVVKLGESSIEIGEVVKVITSIAEQINLLALNATIEAARAGEVGKSFAVVANEVKDLARKTALSSDEIGRKIVSMQSNSEEAVSAISEITGVIARINDMQIIVAASVEEQTSATNEISRSVGEAATGSTEIARNITDVASTARDTTQGAADTQRAAEDLARLAAELTTLVGQFRISETV